MSNTRIKQLLEMEISYYWLKINRSIIDQLVIDYDNWPLAQQKPDSLSTEDWDRLQIAEFLTDKIAKQFKRINKLQSAVNEFKQRLNNAANIDEQLQFMLDFMVSLNYPKKLVKQAAQRKIDYFDENALLDKHTILITNIEREIVTILERLTTILEYTLQQQNSSQQKQTWSRLNLSSRLIIALRYPNNDGINIAAFRCIRRGLATLSAFTSADVAPNVVQYIFRLSLDTAKDIWLRSEAIGLICQLLPEELGAIIERVFIEEEDIFLKARSIHNILKYSEDLRSEYLEQFANDHSEFVRLAFVEYLDEVAYATSRKYLVDKISYDSSEKVQAQAVLTLASLIDESNQKEILDVLLSALKPGAPAFLIRVICNALPKISIFLSQTNENYTPTLNNLFNVLDLLTETEERVDVKRWVNQSRESVWFSQINDLISSDDLSTLQKLPLHKSTYIKKNNASDPETLMRYLAAIAQQRYGFDVVEKKNRWKLTSGFRFKFRTWRAIYEFINPATDKRQNHSHVKGRAYQGRYYIASAKIAEQSKTKVPGEPLFIEQEQGHRYYLPLIDQLFSILDNSFKDEPFLLFSAEGITEVRAPKSFIQKLKARINLLNNFARLSELRDWKEGDSQPASNYLAELQKLGFRFSFRAYDDPISSKVPIDSSVARFFPSMAVPLAIPSFDDAHNYFYSVYQNSVIQLLMFTAVFTVGFIGQHVAALLSLKKWRNKIPLVIGGWGSRGKSGTERLKAALFNAMGVSVLSKTTGCEAMFLYGAPNRPMKELFLFRPYDKATIWEQVFLAKLSGKMGVSVFLWECMGLTPRYIDILQNQWMKDDLSTITNCYPDHEDIQGPAGIEIPIVMQRFIAKKGKVFTTEESMFPLLEDAANAQNAELTKVTWKDIGLISDEVINRFPYEEHPNNIALVMKMAETLGIRKDFALKAMADKVVADLGVLKTYPISTIKGRKIQFINGMSANERFGAISNWQRTGLVKLTIADNAETWTSIVINNRADRIARSKVFASLLVNDTQADRYYFIGNNLAGLQSYIEDAWLNFTEEIILPNSKAGRDELYYRLAKKFRVYTDSSALKQRYYNAVESIAATAESRFETDAQDDLNYKHNVTNSENFLLENFELIFQQPDLTSLKAYLDTNLSLAEPIAHQIEVLYQAYQLDFHELKDFQQHCEQTVLSEDYLKDFLQWLKTCFSRRCIMVDDYYSTGNQTINQIVKHSLPGLLTKVIGMQNIKGTGLDFIYRFQAWDQVYRNCEVIKQSTIESEIIDAVAGLFAWQEFGLLDEHHVIESVQYALKRTETQKELIQAELNAVLQRLERQLNSINKSLIEGQSGSSWKSKVVLFVESFLDSGDAVKRRRKANQIYRLILQNLISFDRAAVELAELTKAQKGGWLLKRYESSFGGKRD